MVTFLVFKAFAKANVLCERYILQLRPRAGSVNSGVAHNWSSVAPCRGKTEPGRARQPSKELRIRGLQNTEELLSCPVLACSSNMDNKDVWLCLQCKATEVGKSSQLDPIEDWRLVISAPLELVNFLPVACKYAVSEYTNGKELTELQSGLVKPGESNAIFLADLRNALYLKWIPEGGWQSQGVRILLATNCFCLVFKELSYGSLSGVRTSLNVTTIAFVTRWLVF
jgi:vacuolar protein sorting-associated protein 13A/C